MEVKKISFGFSKINKKPTILPIKTKETAESKVELIKCLEGQEIKLVVEKQEEAPLVIPLRDNLRTPAALASLKRRKAILLGETEQDVNDNDNETKEKQTNGNLEKDKEVAEDDKDLNIRAAKELLDSINKKNDEEETNSNLVVPVVKPDELPLDGAKQSTLDDYETVPITEFGKAMLRGMGWIEPPKKKDGPPIDDGPMVRPKGMGLGADKAIKPKPLLVAPEKNEVLEIKKQAFVRILAGKYKDLYGQIEGFDDDASRVIIKLAIGGAKTTLNSFLCQPISKKEYSEYGKCINTSKYEEYKKMENEYGQIDFNKIKKEDRDEKTSTRKKTYEEDDKKFNKLDKYSDEKYKEDKYRDSERFKNEEQMDKKYNRQDVYYEDRDYKSYRKDDRSDDYYKTRDSRRDENKRSQDQEYDYPRRDDKKYIDRDSKNERRRKDIEDDDDIPCSSSSLRYNASISKVSSSDDSSSSEDSDSAYERKQKKSKHKSRSRHKSKKSKSKNRNRQNSSSDDNSSGCFSSSEDERRRKEKEKNKKSKKKTKKSKKGRSRSRDRR